ncbi:LOW QUALITY PROTEIN: THAP domain-containing protein 6-like [Tautogolabrus adspersus]
MMRDSESVKTKRVDFKSHVKKKRAERSRELTKTGGGSSYVHLDPLEEKVLGVIGETLVEGVRGGVDTGTTVTDEDEQAVEDARLLCRCANQRCLEMRTSGITFHKFQTGERRRMWELALRRDGFAASDRTVLCSDHFRSEDFDRTGQTVRLKDGVVPSIFSFPAHLQRSVATRSTTTSRRAEDNLMFKLLISVLLLFIYLYILPKQQGATGERRLGRKRQATDHLYSLPACPKAIKAKLEASSARVRKLQREKSNALRREKRAKYNMQALLEELKENNLIKTHQRRADRQA